MKRSKTEGWGEEGCDTCVRTPQLDACETAGRRQRRRAPRPVQSAAGHHAPSPLPAPRVIHASDDE
ncbi:hypothetical protein KGM_211786 [Danaus plexippus plexippus]|uniref:Uncharacterized protein n=1 Tax=Danaus plexippus plexippus TaxID=278856 RepID=A0A212EX49_DANPL|nr:hypothetical protein KGM_211786 [Danaus plexippus plexippus]